MYIYLDAGENQTQDLKIISWIRSVREWKKSYKIFEEYKYLSSYQHPSRERPRRKEETIDKSLDSSFKEFPYLYLRCRQVIL